MQIATNYLNRMARLSKPVYGKEAAISYPIDCNLGFPVKDGVSMLTVRMEIDIWQTESPHKWVKNSRAVIFQADIPFLMGKEPEGKHEMAQIVNSLNNDFVCGSFEYDGIREGVLYRLTGFVDKTAPIPAGVLKDMAAVTVDAIMAFWSRLGAKTVDVDINNRKIEKPSPQLM